MQITQKYTKLAYIYIYIYIGGDALSTDPRLTPSGRLVYTNTSSKASAKTIYNKNRLSIIILNVPVSPSASVILC